ncbi:DgyrCDS3224 [Dimorphilus gyrociliatus]|uniref:DgyrCDS3224 n=1 Tax=Dimorphilus gyrociliatus TaxID=2664684 RepID=A0A7I8VFB5_9ANNE|nr:DgyrCDS3224 [Dimorphilus gyrociliatus]
MSESIEEYFTILSLQDLSLIALSKKPYKVFNHQFHERNIRIPSAIVEKLFRYLSLQFTGFPEEYLQYFSSRTCNFQKIQFDASQLTNACSMDFLKGHAPKEIDIQKLQVSELRQWLNITQCKINKKSTFYVKDFVNLSFWPNMELIEISNNRIVRDDEAFEEFLDNHPNVEIIGIFENIIRSYEEVREKPSHIFSIDSVRSMINYYMNRRSGMCIDPNIFYYKGVNKRLLGEKDSEDFGVLKALLSILLDLGDRNEYIFYKTGEFKQYHPVDCLLRVTDYIDLSRDSFKRLKLILLCSKILKYFIENDIAKFNSYIIVSCFHLLAKHSPFLDIPTDRFELSINALKVSHYSEDRELSVATLNAILTEELLMTLPEKKFVIFLKTFEFFLHSFPFREMRNIPFMNKFVSRIVGIIQNHKQLEIEKDILHWRGNPSFQIQIPSKIRINIRLSKSP